MAQIQSPETYVDGQQVTAARLNNQTNGAILLPGAVTDQTSLAANTVAAGDQVILHDLSATALRKATAGDLLGSGLNASLGTASVETLTTSVINGKANRDINATPNDGVLVTGKTFSSIDGITAVVSSTAHGLESNTCLDITASNPVYSGQYFINVIGVDSFSYTIRQATPVAASGTLSYTKKGTVKVAGNEHITGNLEVVGKTELDGATTVSGTLLATGTSTFSGTSNFTGTLQYKSTPIYGLFNISTFNLVNTVGLVSVINNVRIPIVTNWAVAGGNVTGAGGGVHWNESHTIPTGEMWEITWHWSAMRGGDDYFAVGVIRRQGGGSWIQIEDFQPQPSIYTNSPITTVDVLTNTSGSPVTYDYSFKSAFGGGTGTDQAIVISGGGAVRVIRKYKIA